MLCKFRILRRLFIRVENTPNPLSLKFNPGRAVIDGTMDFSAPRFAEVSPLAKRLWSIRGIVRVFFGSDYIAVTKDEETLWEELKPHIMQSITEFYEQDIPIITEGKEPIEPENDNDSELVGMIKDILATKVRPTVEADGGDVRFVEFNEQTGILLVEMQGSCVGCPSSAKTLKNGIERLLKYYIPQVNEVKATNVNI